MRPTSTKSRILGMLSLILLVSGAAFADGFTPPPDTPVVPWTRFSIQYAIRRVGELSRVEFYITTDGGQTWEKYGDDPDMQSPMLVTVDGDGVYGFYTVAVGPNQRGDRPPRPGTPPDSFIIVDRTPPEARWLSPSEDELLGPGGITLAWEAEDANFGPTPVSIQYSTNEGASWLPLRENLPAVGRFTWEPPLQAGNQISFRLLARDRAGNARAVTNHSMVRIDTLPPTARIIRPTQSSSRTIELEYAATDNEGGTGVAKVDLYATYDEGRTWRHVQTDTELRGRLRFHSEIGNGPVGLKLVATDRANNRSPLPRAGTVPPFVVMIDTVPPNVQISQGFTGGRDEIRGGEPVVVQWSATDPHIDENSSMLEFSANAGQDWVVVARNLPVNQPYYWTPPADTNSRECFLRVTVSDTFGNRGVAVSQVFGVNRRPPSTRIEDIEGMTGPVEPPIDFGADDGHRPPRFPPADPTPPQPREPEFALRDTPPPPVTVGPPPPEPIAPPIPIEEIPLDMERIERGLEELRPIYPEAGETRYPDRTPEPAPPAQPDTPPVEVVDPFPPVGEQPPAFEIPGVPDGDYSTGVVPDDFDIPVRQPDPVVPLVPDPGIPPVPPIPAEIPEAPMIPDFGSETTASVVPDIPEIPDIPSPPPPVAPIIDDTLVRVVVEADPLEGMRDVDEIPALPPIPGEPDASTLVARVPDSLRPTTPVRPEEPRQPTPSQPDVTELLEQAKRAYRTRTEYEAARQFTQRVLEIDPNHAEALALYASILTEEGQFNDAITYAHRAIRQEPTDMAYQMVLGDAHYAYGVSLFHAIRGMPRDTAQRNVETLNAQMFREFDNAEAAFRKVAADRALAKVGFFKLGQVHYFRGNRIYGDVDESRANASLRKAVEQYTRASHIDAIEYREALQIGISLYRLQDYRESQTWLERSIEIADIDTTPREAYYYLAVIHLMEGRAEESLPYWRRVTQSYPEDSRFHQIAVQQIENITSALNLR